jgi:hypothetical protein
LRLVGKSLHLARLVSRSVLTAETRARIAEQDDGVSQEEGADETDIVDTIPAVR